MDRSKLDDPKAMFTDDLHSCDMSQFVAG
jgi:hypothetical protein